MIHSLLFLAGDGYRNFGLKLVLLVFLMVLSSAFEGLALAVAMPLLATLSGSNGSRLRDSGGILPSPDDLLLPFTSPEHIGLLMITLIMASALAFLGQARLSAAMQTEYALRWQTKLFASTLAAGPRLFDQQRSGDVSAALVAEIERVSGAFYHGCILISAVINFLLYFTLAAVISPLTTAMVAGLGLLLFVATRPVMRRAYRYGEAITRAVADIQTLISGHVSFLKEVKANVAERMARIVVSDAAKRLARSHFRSTYDLHKSKAIFEFGGAAGIAILLIIGPLLLNIDLFQIIVVLAIFVRVLPRITALQQSLQALGKLVPALDKVRSLHEVAASLAEKDDPRPLPSTCATTPPTIRYEAVTVSRSGKRILDNVGLVIPSGRIVAFVGPSGSGKSTLVDAILGLVPLASGSITVNGTPLAELPLPAWRRAVGYVGQDTMLMGGTIADNVRFGNDATDAQVEAALARASAAFVGALALGSATEVGDRGVRLSGGERQRIGLARALAVPRLLYILDEATSALDAETEAEVIDTVAQLAGKATVIVVAHRFSAIRAADIIHVVEDGRIVESGRWEELDRPGTRFRTLRALQHAMPDMPAD